MPMHGWIWAWITSQVDTSQIDGYDNMSDVQKRDAVEQAYIAAKNITVEEGATAESLATEITATEAELEAMHDYGKEYAPVGTKNGNAIVANLAAGRKTFIEDQNTRFTAAQDGGQSPQQRLQAAITVDASHVKKDGDDNIKVLYGNEGNTQYVEMLQGGNIIVGFDGENNASYFERGNVYIDDTVVKVGNNDTYEPLGIVYETLHGTEATGPKGIKEILPSIEANIGGDFKFAPATTEQLQASNQELAQRAQAVTDAGYTLSEADASDVGEVLKAEQKIVDNNTKYEANKADIEDRWNILVNATTTGVAVDSTGSKKISYTSDGDQTIVLNNNQEILVKFDAAGEVASIQVEKYESADDRYYDLFMSAERLLYNPDEESGENDTNNNVVLDRIGTIYTSNLYSFQSAIDYVKALAQANNFEIKKKEDEGGETPAT